MSEFKPIQIGKYLLVEPIGGGGMGEVYRGKLIGAGKFNKEVAIKRILPGATSDPEIKTMFEAEAAICSRLNHPNIISVFDFFYSDQGFLMAMEFLHGKNLRQISHRLNELNSDISLDAILFIINEVCKGLNYAHSVTDENGKKLMLIHRDISPQNIMVSYEGAVKIVDFGLAKTRERSDITRTGTVKGKVAYMSPEQTTGQPLDQTTDIFSLGVVLHELLTKQRLFKGENEIVTMRMIANAEVFPPSSKNPNIPHEVDEIVMRALAPRPFERYQTGVQMSDAITQLLAARKSIYQSLYLSQWMQEIFAADIEKEKEASLQLMRRSSLPVIEESSSTQVEIFAEKKNLAISPPVRKFNFGLEHFFILLAFLGLAALGYLEMTKTNSRGDSNLQGSSESSTNGTGNSAEAALKQKANVLTDNEVARNATGLVRTLETLNDNIPLPTPYVVSRNDFDQIIAKHGKEAQKGAGWFVSEKLGKATVQVQGLMEFEEDKETIEKILKDVTHYPEWLNGVNQPSQVANVIRNIGDQVTVKLSTSRNNVLEYTSTSIEGVSALRQITAEPYNEGDHVVLKLNLEEAIGQSFRGGFCSWRIAAQQPKPKFIWAYTHCMISARNSMVIKIIELQRDITELTKTYLTELNHKLVQRAKEFRTIASKGKK